MITNAPEWIWLNYGDIGYLGDIDHSDCQEVSWSDHRVFNDDVEYVRNAPDEIKSAHPKCGECKWMVNDDDYDSHACDNANGISIRRRLDPDKDYCRHWEAKQ